MYCNSSLKRSFDLLVSLPGLVVAVPVTFLCAFAIALESRGSPIYRQTRVGINNTLFTCYKLRTMKVGIANRPTHETPKEAVTRIGRFLRATKIDELPQLWNVLVGEMSLVGPRPCLPSQDELIAERERRGVHLIRPGITGLAQTQGVDMSHPKRLAELDAEYIKTASLKQDLAICIRTALPFA